MGERTITLRFCDSCDKEIIGRLTVHTCPCCGKDICVECQEKEDSKHKPRERKPKTESNMTQEEADEVVRKMAGRRPDFPRGKEFVDEVRHHSRKDIIPLADIDPLTGNLRSMIIHEPDIISTFSMVTGQDNKLHTLKMGDTTVAAKTLKAGVKDLLGRTGLTEKDVEEAPESEGKRLLLNIFNPKPSKT